MQKYIDFFDSVNFNKDSVKNQTFIDGVYSQKLDSSYIYSDVFELPYREITSKDHAWIRVNSQIFLSDTIIGQINLVFEFSHKNKAYKYKAINLNNGSLKPKKWNNIVADYLTPEVRSIKDKLRVYFWYRGNSKYILINKFEAWAFERIEE